VVWHDLDGDGLRDQEEPGVYGARVELWFGGAEVMHADTIFGGPYSFSGLPPHETYTVREVQPGWLRWSTTPDEVTLLLGEREAATVNFGDWDGLPRWVPVVLR
jgi:hypothetical protein